MNSPTMPIEGTSSERGRAVHLLRHLVFLVPLAIVGIGLATLAGALPLMDRTTSAATSLTAPVEGGSDEPASDLDVTPSGGRAPASPTTVPPPDEPVAPGSTIEVELRPGTARLEAGPVRRVIDTRSIPTADSIDLPDPAELGADSGPVSGLVLSVSLLDSSGPGTVTATGSFGSLDVLTVDRAGASTSGLVVVPGSDPARLVNPAGGDLVVDLVGTFVATASSASGRFTLVEPARLAHLETATDGRELEVDLGPFVDPSLGASAALVLITADVGDGGGRIGIGPDAGALDQMLMWGPPAGPDRQRSGVVLVAPGPDGRFAIRYDGGSILDVDLLGYATADVAPVSTDGLFVPASSITTFDRVVPAGTSTVADAPAGVGAAFVGLRAAPGRGLVPQPTGQARDLTVASGRTIGTVLPVGPGPTGGPGVQATSAVELEARIQIFGYFLATGS